MKVRSVLVAGFLATLSLGARAQVFYTVQESTDALCTVDTATLAFTPVGPLGVPYNFGDLAYDSSTGTMYMSSGWGSNPSNLYTVSLTTGAATLVGSTGVNGVFGLAYDPSTNKLYGSISTSGITALLEISRATGAATTVGDPGHNIDGLTYVGSTGDLVGLHAGPGSLHTLNRLTGQSTLLSAGGGFVDNCGIAWSQTTNKIYSIDWSGNLFSFDVANSYARQTLATGLGAYDGLAAAGGGCAPAVSYCTAGTTSNGCVPVIGSTGTPSASAGSGFVINVALVEGQRSGLIFYGINNTGWTPLPWASGSTSYLCVKPPTQRTFAQSSGGTNGSCNGVLSIDWNAFIAGYPGALGAPFAANATVYAQGWFRDPAAPKTTNLSNGLQFSVCP